MTDGQPPVTDPAGQVQPLMEEARLAKMQAEDAVHRIQQRIERLVSLSEQSEGEGRDFATTTRRSD